MARLGKAAAQHRELVQLQSHWAQTVARKAEDAAIAGDCATAFDYLVTAARDLAKAETHSASLPKGGAFATDAAYAAYGKADQAFKQHCRVVRKPKSKRR